MMAIRHPIHYLSEALWPAQSVPGRLSNLKQAPTLVTRSSQHVLVHTCDLIEIQTHLYLVPEIQPT